MSTVPNPSPLADLMRRIRLRIERGELGEALELLSDLALSGTRSQRDDASLLRGQYADLTRDERRAIKSEDTLKRQRQQIRAAALDLLSELESTLPASAGPVPAPSTPKQAFETTEAVRYEKIIGVNNLRQIGWLQQGLTVSRAVCRVQTPSGMGTGFLIGRGLLMTNNHVIPSKDVAQASTAEFDYQHPFGTDASVAPHTTRYHIDPAIFLTSPATLLDYTIVKVKEVAAAPPLSDWGLAPLNPDADPVRGDYLAIVQHPNGQTKQVALTANAVLQVKPPVLHYSTDTMKGSSGAPVNDLWQVIAIHHADGPTITTPDGRTHYSNEGILISAINRDLDSKWPL
jgi:V8-like Glu-specific endopeptidase